MAVSMLRHDVFMDDNLRRRVTAIVMNHRWDDPAGNVRDLVPIDEIMWAVAAADSILDGVQSRMTESNDPDMSNQPIKAVSDEELESVVLNVALPRLYPPQQDSTGEAPEKGSGKH